MGTRSGKLNKGTLHNLSILLNISETSTSEKLSAVTRPCLSSRISGSTKWEGKASFKMARFKPLPCCIKLKTSFETSLPWHGLHLSGRQLRSTCSLLPNEGQLWTIEVLIARKLSLACLARCFSSKTISVMLRHFRFEEKIWEKFWNINTHSCYHCSYKGILYVIRLMQF